VEVQSKIFIYPKTDFLHLLREILCVEFFTAPINSPAYMLRAKMDLRSILTYLSMKDMNAKEIYADMNDILQADCIGHSTITKELREKSFLKSMLDTDFEPKIKEENCIDEVILGALE
jgi:hypothetical protein